MQTRGSLIACGCSQLSISQRLVVFLVTPTVTAVAVLNGPLGSLDICCLWLLGLWHEAHASVKR